MANIEPTMIPPSLAEALRSAQHVTVLTGAGISAESGLPTFRDKMTGLWAQYRPEDLATPEAFRRDPKLVWEWYEWRRGLVRQAEPNAGHRALVEMEHITHRFTLITQNVDGLHQEAGSSNVIELHGNIRRSKCFDEDRVVTEWADTGEKPPRCPDCAGPLRPDVVWFGESLPREALHAAAEASQLCDVLLSVGTSGLVQPAASLPYVAADSGATVIFVNLDVATAEEPPFYHIHGKAGEVLPALVAAVWPEEGRGNGVFE
jgi:NAD-dependent deacetylase